MHRRWLTPGLVVAGLLVAGVAAGAVRPGRGDPAPLRWTLPFEPPQTTSGPDASGVRLADGIGDTGGLSLWTVTLLAVIVLAPVVVLLAKLVLRAGRAFAESERAGPPPPEPDLPEPSDPAEVLGAVRAGLADLDAGQDPRRAVIACWLALERAAATAGTPRLVSDTPGDLVARLLSEHAAGDALRRLEAAYHLARYSPHPVGDELRVTARQALARVETLLAAGAAG